MKRTLAALGAAIIAVAGISATAMAEGQIRIAEQYGISYLPLHVIRDQKLIEKHGKAEGLDITVEWAKLSGGAAQNDALLSGSIDVAAAGVGPALTIWDRTRGTVDVRAIASLGSLPSFLITNNPKVKTLQDFTSADKIAVPAVGVSVQSRTLQIAAEKAFGEGQHKKLDELTVSLPHPDATAALLSGGGQLTAHFSNPPFQYQALKDPKIHKVLSSYDVLGGRATSNLAYTTAKFREDNPKTYKAFVEALKEAVAWIEANKQAAAETYIRVEKSKLDPELILSIVQSPEVSFTLKPERTFVYAEFLSRTGAIKNKPSSWKDYVFPDIQDVEGS
ncbi:ABC transporter substrate-binding protein [Methylopila henanensis]|uniref:ABC transporter substrate-binding protein n=1 Tax=Methylopila henanensis TaxID=873516 RepID=A0ABW4KA87_9HYPH